MTFLWPFLCAITLIDTDNIVENFSILEKYLKKITVTLYVRHPSIRHYVLTYNVL